MFRQLIAPAVASALMLAPLSQALAAGEDWEWDAKAALERAAAEDKDLLMDFTGSDWCGWCIKLDKEVFSQDAFKESVIPEQFVLTAIDFPRRKEQSDEVKAFNKELGEKYGVRGYPTILLADSQGRPYAKTGYQAGGAESYVDHLKELQQIRVKRDEHFAKADQAEGAAKAEALNTALSDIDNNLVLEFYGDEIDTIIEHGDEELKSQWASRKSSVAFTGKLQKLMQEGQQQGPAKMIESVQELIDAEKPQGETLQQALMLKAQLQHMTGNKADAKATLESALEADPESEMGDRIETILEEHFADEEPETEAAVEDAADEVEESVEGAGEDVEEAGEVIEESAE